MRAGEVKAQEESRIASMLFVFSKLLDDLERGFIWDVSFNRSFCDKTEVVALLHRVKWC